MKTFCAVMLSLFAAAIATAAPPKPAPHAVAASRDWSQVAAFTPDEGVLLGNPQAKVKLIEYLSLTCPHCAVFEDEAVPKLIAKYVKAGRVSYEVRFALRDPFDLAAVTLARCDGPRRFFDLAPVLYAAQNDWEAKAQAWASSGPDLSKMSEAEAGKTVMKGAGLDKIVAAHGLPVAKAEQCFADVDGSRRLSAKAQAIWAIPGFAGTPGFSVDGKLKADIHDWAGLDAALTAALR